MKTDLDFCILESDLHRHLEFSFFCLFFFFRSCSLRETHLHIKQKSNNVVTENHGFVFLSNIHCLISLSTIYVRCALIDADVSQREAVAGCYL